MDGEQELAEFKKSNQPSLLGVTVRNDFAEGETPEPDQIEEGEEAGEGSGSVSAAASSRSRSRSRARANKLFTKKADSLFSQLDSSIADLQFEGALLNDDEGVLDDVLDEEGHLKEDALQVKEQEKIHEEEEEDATPSHATTTTTTAPSSTTPALDATATEVDDHKLEIFGGDAEKYIAPASGMQSSFAMASPSISKTMEKEENFELFKSEEVPSLQDVIQQVNSGEIPTLGSLKKDAVSEEKKTVSSPLKHVTVTDPEVPDFAIENDSEFIAPASAREGSSSRYLSSSRHREFSPSPLKNSTGLNKPHLARGDSYHGGLASDDYNDSSSSSLQDTTFERKPRHEPGSTRGHITNPSSLNYLRSISRSRSRIANDRSALGDKTTDEQELKEEGALLGDPYDQNSALEDAVTKALNINEPKTISPLSKEQDTHLSGIAEDADEEEENEENKEEGTKEEDKVEETKENTVEEETPEVPVEATSKETEETEATEESETKEIETVSESKEAEVEPKVEEKEPGAEKEEEEVEVEAEEPKADTKVEEEEPEKDIEVEETKEVESPVTEKGEVSQSDEKEVKEEAEDQVKEKAVEAKEKELEETTATETKEAEVDEQPAKKEESSITKEVLVEKSKKQDDDDLVFDIPELNKETKPSGSVGADGSVFVPKESKLTFEDEPVYIYTSLAGGFQIMSRTNRLITILTANKITYECKDLGTDEEAKKVWRRYSGGKTLPGIVRGKDDYIGNWQDIEDANENYAVRSLIYETF